MRIESTTFRCELGHPLKAYYETEGLHRLLCPLCDRDVVAQLKPVVRLVGADGNAFMVLGLCQRAAREAGWSPEHIDAVMEEMRSGDYNNLLATAMKHFDVR